MPTKTYFLCQLQDGGQPTHQHATFDLAQVEARRLVERFARPVTILQAVHVVAPAPRYVETPIVAMPGRNVELGYTPPF